MMAKNCPKFFHLKHLNIMTTVVTRWNISLNNSDSHCGCLLSREQGDNQCGQKLTRMSEVTFCQFYADVLYEWAHNEGKNHSGNQWQEQNAETQQLFLYCIPYTVTGCHVSNNLQAVSNKLTICTYTTKQAGDVLQRAVTAG